MKTVTINALTPETEEICAIRLVGGFDSKKNFIKGLDWKWLNIDHFMDEVDDYNSPVISKTINFLEKIAMSQLILAEDLVIGDVRYIFDIKRFTEPESLKWVTLDLIAQIIEE